MDDICKDFGEVAGFALQLIAKVCSQTERHEIANEANKRALKLNPFLWQSFADLCNRGQKPDPKAIFQFSNIETFATCQGHNINATVSFDTPQQHLSTSDNNSPLIINNNQQKLNNSSYNICNNNSSSNNSVQTTPVDQINSNNIMITPNNNINNSVRGVVGGGGGLGNFPFEDTPIGWKSSNTDVSNNLVPPTTVRTPYPNQFKYLTTISPSTPSFGVLPMYSPGDSFCTPPNQQQQLLQQSQAMLVEVNDQKSVGKKIKGNVVGSIINRKDTPLQVSKPIFSQTGNITPRGPSLMAGNNGGQNVRRSSRLSFSNYSVKENNKSVNINKFAAPRSPPRKTKQRITKMNLTNTALNEINEKQQKEKIETITSTAHLDNKVFLNNSINSFTHHQNNALQLLHLKKQSAEGLMVLLRELADGYIHLSQYNCKEAIETFSNVPPHHYTSSWVQSMIAKAYYEQRDYDAAAKIFQDIHKKEPHRMHLMEIYSTVLWHLQREVQLSALAQDLIAQDKASPITWCVSGNCFSLHKEHETAIKFFERAVQVDPEYAYSYTLLGHELVITEELEKAMSCFRTAILKDSRHYNAWFGIGTIFSKQERYNLAEIHYKLALRINSKNSVIMVHVGAMQFLLKKYDLALQTLNAAITLDPKNPLCKFHRGSMYFQMGKHQEALRELEELKQILPKESVVYYLIGKIHKKLGNVDSALMHFSWATDLDPKGANNQIKDAFDANISQSTATAFVVDPDGEPEHSDDSIQIRNSEIDEPDYDSDSY